MNNKIHTISSLALAAAALGFNGAAFGQNLLPNPSFEQGEDRLPGWTLSDGRGRVTRARGNDAADGQVWVSVEGDGKDPNWWRTADLALQPGGLYCFGFVGRRAADARGGTAMAGPSRVNRDFPLGDRWEPQEFVFMNPHTNPQDFVRLGQWEVRGRLDFDAAELVPVLAAHARPAPDVELGEAESIRQGVYRFEPNLNWRGANYHRPLVTNRAGFNSNRWQFWPGAEVVYRFALPGSPQTAGALRAAINYHAGGTLQIDASRDGQSWVPVAEFNGEKRGGRAELPKSLFPSDGVFVRFSQPGQGAGFQVDTFEYEATLQNPPQDAEGQTLFIESRESSRDLGVALGRWTPRAADGGHRVELTATNNTSRPVTLTAAAACVGIGLDSSPSVRPATVSVPAGQVGRLDLPIARPAAGEHRIVLTITNDAGQSVFRGTSALRVGLLDDASYGYWLDRTEGLTAWWCESGWKVGRDRAAPVPARMGERRLIEVAAARNEFEAVQLVLRSDRETALLEAPRVSLRDDRGNPSPIEVRFDEVAYVHVTQPTDATCVRGWYPDPLPPLKTPLNLTANRNQPLWITFRVPAAARAGRHRGEIEVKTAASTSRAPLEVEVYDFTLPDETHLHSALGLGTHEINRYHGLSEGVDKVAVFEKYLKNFAEHRISSYSFFDYAPIRVRFEGEGANKRAQVDFAQFDAAARTWLDEHHFSTFRLPLHGMGGGTFHSRELGELEGFQEGTPEHAALFRDYLGQVERHLRKNGWLDKAFTYWFDEPDPKDYAFVVAGQERIKDAAPGLRRMLTEQPEKELMGHVDIWCGLTPEWTPETVRARQEAGEKVWWYICTGPKAPYVTEFIDHPGTELRLWPWQSWQYGVSGALVWATVYWTSPLAYPEPKVQDPWSDPMSWVTGYGNPVGYRSPWGNGDGRFLYPPRRDPNTSTAPNLDAPINSLRWENLRDGMEDYEYLWLLDQELKRAAARQAAASFVQEARGLLEVPESVSKDLTHFTTDPRPILAHRAKVARMIERLRSTE